jgi:hypothetical protein
VTKEVMPRRGINRQNPAPEVAPCFSKQIKGQPLVPSSTYGLGVPFYNRSDLRKLKKEARNYRGNAGRAKRSI